ncbi:hypothetical protein FRC12_001625 [Ceratobasidium sp. 428]|nr:hypothetical protein FRC12_001625 [Ceratobasidium sp. 428]
MSVEARLQTASTTYQKLQDDLQTAVESRQRLDAQLNENELVKKVCADVIPIANAKIFGLSVQEFATLKSHNTVFKLIGPVLVKQDQEEAKSNVNKRLEYIRGEISRVETQISDLTKKSEKSKNEIVTIQAVMQAKAQKAEEGVAA